MVNSSYNTTEDLINKLQDLKGRTKVNFSKNICKCYDNMNIRMDEDSFARNAHRISKNYHEVLLLMKILPTKPQLKNMNINYFDL